MTNGRIWFLHDNSVYRTVTFYGDMHPRGKARYILGAFAMGRIYTAEDFYRIVEGFHRKYHRHKPERRETLVESPRGICAEHLDVTGNLEDYIYLINMSGETQRIRDCTGRVGVPDRTLAVVHYRQIEKLLPLGEKDSRDFIKK